MLIFQGGMKVKENDKPRNDPKLEPKKDLRKMLNRFWQIQLATKKREFSLLPRLKSFWGWVGWFTFNDLSGDV